MQNYQQKIIKMLKVVTVEEARQKILAGEFGDIDSPNYCVAMAWLNMKESQENEKHDARVMEISKRALETSIRANKIAIAAIVISLLTAIIVAAVQMFFK